MNEPLENVDLLAFTRTVEAKSLSRAAEELGAPRTTIGRRLTRLEKRLGVRLLRRTTRALVLTDAGHTLYRHARLVLDAAAQAEASVRRSDAPVRGVLRVAMPPAQDPSLNALLCEFARAHPQVQMQVDASPRIVDLVREGYDVALRATTDLEPGLVARTITRTALRAVASPAYLAKRGTPKLARDLKAHACLVGFTSTGLPRTHWPKAGGGSIFVEGTFAANDIALLLDAALHGLGIAVLPMLFVERALATGKLIVVLPDIIGADTRFCVVYREKELLAPQVRAFVDMVVGFRPEVREAMRQRFSWNESEVAPKRAGGKRASPRVLRPST